MVAHLKAELTKLGVDTEEARYCCVTGSKLVGVTDPNMFPPEVQFIGSWFPDRCNHCDSQPLSLRFRELQLIQAVSQREKAKLEPELRQLIQGPIDITFTQQQVVAVGTIEEMVRAYRVELYSELLWLHQNQPEFFGGGVPASKPLRIRQNEFLTDGGYYYHVLPPNPDDQGDPTLIQGQS